MKICSGASAGKLGGGKDILADAAHGKMVQAGWQYADQEVLWVCMKKALEIMGERDKGATDERARTSCDWKACVTVAVTFVLVVVCPTVHLRRPFAGQLF